jgi:hypothetical protein
MSDRRDGLVSYHLIGAQPNGDVFIQPLNDNVPENLTMWDVLAFERLCKQAGAKMVCTLRCRQEGDRLAYYHSFLSGKGLARYQRRARLVSSPSP